MKNGMVFLIAVVVLFVAGNLLHTQINAANSYLGIQKGMIHLAYVEYNDSDTVTITAGYGECNGHYWEITEPIDHDMTSLAAAEDFHYIYIDDANSVYSDPVIIDSTAEPAWSNDKLGWYNGNDRCIGVVWSPSGGAVIKEYASNSNLMYTVVSDTIAEPLSNGNPTGIAELIETTAYIPVNAVAVRVFASNWDTNGWLSVLVRSEGIEKAVLANGGYSVAKVCGWIELERGCSRDLEWRGENDDDNSFQIEITGYQIER